MWQCLQLLLHTTTTRSRYRLPLPRFSTYVVDPLKCISFVLLFWPLSFTKMDKKEGAQMLADCLRVSVHQILRAKVVYPPEVFDAVQKCNMLVYKSRYPGLNAYIDSAVAAAEKLLNESLLERFTVVVNCVEGVEKFIFRFDRVCQSSENELDFIEIKQQFRTLWTILGSRFTSSPQKEQDSTFKFEMLAKGAADERLLHAQRSTECDMAWAAACDKDNDCPESITPIMNVRNRQLAVEVYVEKHRTSSPGEHSENARHPP